ncbi:MAG: hypothetical protein WBL63_14100 [Candidatus Acidiferrum sp.]
MIRKLHGVGVCSAVFLFVFLLWSGRADAQAQGNSQASASPLVRVLQTKGILSAEEVAQLNQSSSASDGEQRLAKLLLSKGVISQTDYNQMTGNPGVVTASSTNSASLNLIPAVYRVSSAVSPKAAQPPTVDLGRSYSDASISRVSSTKKFTDLLPGGTEATTDIAFGTIAPEAPAGGEPGTGPSVVPAFAPIRVLPVGLMGRESVKAVISAGPVHIQPYGFFKMNIIEDSSNPFSLDAPLSGMLGENPAPLVGTATNLGPDANPQFHVNARSSRFGSNFEWLDDNEKLVVTGKIEGDFEGNYTTVSNRGISSARSSMFGLRIAYGRLDYHATDHAGVFGEFGQNWTLFCSSTLPSSNETTLLGVEFGTCYERLMQARFGANWKFGNGFQIQPEFALAYPAIGNGTAPTATTTTCSTPTGTTTCVNAFTPGSQLTTGERSGADSNRPEYEGRIALQFRLDKAEGVAPAQLIVSGMYGKARLLVASNAVPTAFHADFLGGASTEYKTWGLSGEAQLPTRWFTLQGKWWTGGAMRFYFVDNLLTSFNPTASFLAANPGGVVSTVTSVSGEGTAVAFGCTVALVAAACPTGSAQVLPQEPVRGVGGFGDLGIPLSRLFHANPKGRNSGWTLDLGYNVDQSKARDLRHTFAAAGGRYKNDWARATLNYKLNSWVQIGFEEGYYRTKAIPGPTGGLPLVIDGREQRVWKDLHEQISTVFFF